MRKLLLGSLIFVGMLSNVAYAENQAGNQNNKSSVQINQTNVDKSGFLGFCKGKYQLTGCFIGAEVGLAFVDNSFWLDFGSVGYGSKSSIAFPVNLNFGWQVVFSRLSRKCS